MTIPKKYLDEYNSLSDKEKADLNAKYASHCSACRKIGVSPSNISEFISDYMLTLGTKAHTTILTIYREHFDKNQKVRDYTKQIYDEV